MRKIEFNKLLFLVCLTILWIVSGWNYDNSDIESYKKMYDESSAEIRLSQLTNPGLSYVISIFLAYNIPFDEFHVIVFGLIMACIVLIVFIYSKKPLMVLFVYLITAFFGDIIQLKNTLALFFFYPALIVLLNKEIKYRKIIYAVLITLSASFHIAFVFYYIFLFCDKELPAKKILLFSILLAFFGHNIFGFLSNNPLVAESDHLTERQEQYFSTGSYWSLLICLIQYIAHVIVCKKYILLKDANMSNNVFNQLLFNVNVILSTLLIFSSISMSFFRLFRNMILFDSIFLINGYYYLRPSQRKPLLLILYFAIVSTWQFWMSEVHSNVLFIFENNYLWK